MEQEVMEQEVMCADYAGGAGVGGASRSSFTGHFERFQEKNLRRVARAPPRRYTAS